MPRLILTLLVLGLLAALTGLWVLERFEPRRGAAVELVPTAARTEASTITPALETPEASASQARGPSIRAEAPTFDEHPSAESASAAVDSIRVVTVIHGSDTPLPGTVIGLATRTRMSRFREAHPESEGVDLEQLVGRAGELFVTDENGEATLPFYGEGMRVTARHEDRFTYVWIAGGETEPVRIELFVDRELSIQVVDTAGAPQSGVPVSIVLETLRGDSELWKGETVGDDGLATVRHADVRIAPAYGLGGLAASLKIPLREPALVSFEHDPWPSEPLQIVMPGTGSVTVSLLDPESQPYEERARVSLYVEWEDGPKGKGRTKSYHQYAENGVAHFEHVGLETQMRVSARSEDELKPQTEALTGPLRVGEDVPLALTFTDRYPRIVGRLVAGNGQPLASSVVEAEVLSNSPTRSRTRRSRDTLETDGQGRFALVVTQRLRQGGRRTVEFHGSAGGERPADLFARVDLSSELPDEDIDLGDVQLEPIPLICAGLVLDDSGAPVAGADLRLQYARDILGSRQRVNWERSSSAASDAQGRFELRGDVPPVDLRVVASKSGWNNVGPVPIVAGRTDVILRLERGGGLEGTLSLNEGVPARMFEVRAHWEQVEASGKRSRRSNIARPQPSGNFRFERLPPGPVKVTVTLAGLGTTLRTIDGVFVSGGEMTRAPRLQAIDLTAEVFAYDIEVVDSALRPVDSGRVSVLRTGGKRKRPVAFAIRAGRARLISLESLVDVVVVAPGFLRTVIRGLHTDQRVMLEAAIPVRLRLSDEIALPQPPLYLQAKLLSGTPGKKRRRNEVTQIFRDGQRVGTSNPLSLDESNIFGPSRELQIQVSEPGPQRLYFVLLKKRPAGGSRSQIVGGGKKAEIRVGAQDAGRTFKVAPPRTQYERALQRLAK